jgi:chromatin structure-remodeling complex subunit RSC9
MNLEENNRLKGVPAASVQNIMDWILLDDEELVHASLDFLYQYTAVVDNVDLMITELSIDPLINQLSRLLLHGARTVDREFITVPEVRRPGRTDIPEIPQDLMAELLKLDEPTRSSSWLRCLFEEDKDESITQIALWQAYQARFASAVQPDGGRPLLPAADFIKNVSTTFQDKATAQVQAGPVQKFIIKGIRIRDAPVDLSGNEYSRCHWSTWSRGEGNLPVIHECSEYFMTAEQMYNHILTKHVQVPRSEDGKFTNAETSLVCHWKGCQKYPTATTMKASVLGAHIKIHVKNLVPTPSNKDKEASTLGGLFEASAGGKRSHKTPSWITPAVKQSWSSVETPVDERGDAAGIPLTAVLVLRNLARNLPKTEAEEIEMKEPGGISYVDRLFKPIEAGLWQIFANNKSLVSVQRCPLKF